MGPKGKYTCQNRQVEAREFTHKDFIAGQFDTASRRVHNERIDDDGVRNGQEVFDVVQGAIKDLERNLPQLSRGEQLIYLHESSYIAM